MGTVLSHLIRFVRNLVVSVVIAAVAVTLVVMAPIEAWAVTPPPSELQKPQDVKAVDGSDLAAVKGPSLPAMPASNEGNAAWPGGTSTNESARSAQSTGAATSNDSIATTETSGAEVANTVLPQSVSNDLGIVGVAVKVGEPDVSTASGSSSAAGKTGQLRSAPSDGGAVSGSDTSTSVKIDYSSFENAVGGDWSARLTLVEFPECAAATPQLPECQTATPVRGSRNDVAERTVTGEVSSARAVVAAVAAPAGAGGDFGATSLAPSGSWSVGGNTGSFSWGTPIDVPNTASGLAPSISLGYSSATVDGRQSATNNQSSWLGEGWDYDPGFIERSYTPCESDKTGSNVTAKTGDLCWKSDNATLSLNGQSNELVRIGNTNTYRLKDHDGTLVTKLTGGANGDNDGEYWRVDATDGKQYYFGQDRLPGWAAGKPVTNSTNTVPVRGNQSGEPCYVTAAATSWCQQGYRWRLSYVVDPKGQSASYWYTKESNNYGFGGQTKGQAYDRASYLNRIEYGTTAGSELATKAPHRVTFGVAERCLTTATFACTDAQFTTANASKWPDTPVDQFCATGKACTTQFSPTFWSRKRLVSITTEVIDAAGAAYTPVDRWAFVHTFPNSGDGMSPALWLWSLQRTGLVGGSVSMPPVEFRGTQMPNRVDTTKDGLPALNRYRMTNVTSETGAIAGVEYLPADCTATSKPTADDTNTRRCYPVSWSPDGAANPIKEYFHVYPVAKTYSNDMLGTQPTLVTSYQYDGGMAWAYDQSEFTEDKDRSWNNARGFAKVKTLVGSAPDPVRTTETTYFRGLDGDKTASGTRSVEVSDSDGRKIRDSELFSGIPREEIEFNNGTFESSTIYEPWVGGVVTSRARPGLPALEARASGTGRVETKLKDGAGWKRSASKSTFDQDGNITESTDEGDLANPNDQTCSRTDFVRKGTFVLPSRSWKAAEGCRAGLTLTEGNFLADTRYFYDGSAALGSGLSKGLVTREEVANGWSGASPTYGLVANRAYDASGQMLSETDSAGRATKYEYVRTPAGNGPIIATAEVNPLGHRSTQTFERFRGEPLSGTDVNGRATHFAYDPLGRDVKTWLPGRTTAQTPSIEIRYFVAKGSLPYTETKSLNHREQYVSTYDISDGLGRPRQTQVATAGGRLVSDTFYNAYGDVSVQRATYLVSGSPAGTVTSVPENQVPAQTRTTYDGLGRVSAEILEGFAVEKWRTTTTYGPNAVYVDPPEGQAGTAAFTDLQGRIVEARRYPSGAASPSGGGDFDKTTWEYDQRGLLTKVTAPGNVVRTFKYDMLGREVESNDPDAGVTKTAYDSLDRVESTTDGAGRTIFNVYDALDRVIETRDGNATGAIRTKSVYDTVAKGVLSSSERHIATGSGTDVYRTRVDSVNTQYQPTKSTVTMPVSAGPLAGDYVSEMAYNFSGDLSAVTHPAKGGLPAERVQYAYDEFDRLKSATGNGGYTYISGIDYTAYGQVSRVAAGLDKSRLWSSFVYDGTTRRVGSSTIARSKGVSTTLETRSFVYDQTGNTVKVSSSTLDSESAAGVSAAGGAIGETECYRFDGLSRLSEAWSATNGCTSGPALGTVGPDGKVGAATVGGPAPFWTQFEFDGRGNRSRELQRAVPATSAVGAGPGSGTSAGAGSANTVDVDRRYVYPAEGEPRPNGLVSVTGVAGTGTDSFEYDQVGASSKRVQGGVTYEDSYDVEGRLSRTVAGGVVSDFVYDAAGARVLKRESGRVTAEIGGSEYVWDVAGQKVTGTRMVGSGGNVAAYRAASMPVAAGATSIDSPSGTAASAGKVSFTLADGQGTGQWLVDGETQAASLRRFTPYGAARPTPDKVQPSGAGGGTTNSAGAVVGPGAAGSGVGSVGFPQSKVFVGGTDDTAATGLVNVGARQYDPVNGRFTSVDPIIDYTDPNQMLAYAYAGNNPVRFSDPSGLFRITDSEGTTYSLRESRGQTVFTYYSGPYHRAPKSRKATRPVQFAVKKSAAATAAWDRRVADRKRDLERSAARSEALREAGVSEADYAQAHAQKQRQLKDVLIESGIDLFKEVTGIADIENCISNPGIGSCGGIALQLGMGAFWKIGKFLKGVKKAWGAYQDWKNANNAADAVLSRAGDIDGAADRILRSKDAISKGKAGEAKVASLLGQDEMVRETFVGSVTNKKRITDGIGNGGEVVEVKNVAKQSYTGQIKDLEAFAKGGGRQLDIYVRTDTKITKPLKDASMNGTINIRRML